MHRAKKPGKRKKKSRKSRSKRLADLIKSDPILKLRGLGKEIWKGVDPDEYVRRLRDNWE